MKKAIFAIVVLGVCVLMYFYGEETKGQEMQRDIAEQVIRLHVVANSDSEEDQALKLQVKEEVVNLLREELKEDTSVVMAQQTIRDHLQDIRERAKEYIQKKGYEYEVDAELGTCYFPIKEYGDMTFPPGEYKALKVKIGKSQGKNWWCVMYPTLCFVDSTYQIVPEDSKEKLKENLTPEEYESLLQGGDDVEYGFAIVDFLADLF